MKTIENTYWVWRRSDGYVNGTAYNPLKYPGGADKFEILLTTQDWYGEAVPRIEAERRGCQYCKATGVALEPFNAAGNLACKDGKGCSFRMATAGLKPIEITEVKGCSRCRRDVPAGPAFEDQDGWLVCAECREHIGTCDDPDCDHA